MTDDIHKRPITPEGEGRADEGREHDHPTPEASKEGAVEAALDRATAPVGEDDRE